MTYLSDDWGREDQTWEMNCRQCCERFVSYEYHYFDEKTCKGESMHRWITIHEKDAFDRLKEELRCNRESLSEIAKNRYLRQWLTHFAGKSKKSVWCDLRADGHVPTLGTFYKHLRPGGIEEYLEWYLCEPEKVAGMISILAIQDSEIQDTLVEIGELQAACENSEIAMVRNGVT